MTIRRRLALSFAVILALFAINLAFYFWSNQRRRAQVEGLRQANELQSKLAGFDKRWSDLARRVALLNQAVELSKSGAPQSDIEDFNKELERSGILLREAATLAAGPLRRRIEDLRETYQKLGASWRVFYPNFGRNPAIAIAELAVRGEPLNEEVRSDLAEIEKDVAAHIQEAGATFDAVQRLTNQITLLAFSISTLVAIWVAYRVSRDVTVGLETLKVGALLIGGGSFNHRIPVKGDDEIADLAQAYNDMAHNLYQAQKQMTLANIEMERRNELLDRQVQVSDSLLLNILPLEIASELQARGSVQPKYFEDVTILFTDFAGFTVSTEKLAAEELVEMLHDYFTAFDKIVERYGLEKMKTIGDSYMCVGGLPERSASHPVDVVLAAFEMLQVVRERDRPDARVRLAIRIGIHSGPVVAGVVGIRKFAFDIWGDDVNFASRMESSGEPNRINISSRTYSRVKDFFDCEFRGRVQTKDKREAVMYFVNGVQPALLDDLSGAAPPAFARRYRIYFQKDPPSFPAPGTAGVSSNFTANFTPQ